MQRKFSSPAYWLGGFLAIALLIAASNDGWAQQPQQQQPQQQQPQEQQPKQQPQPQQPQQQPQQPPQQPPRAETFRQFGEVVEVTQNQVTILLPDGQRKTFEVHQDARILLEGRRINLQELNRGDEVLLTLSREQPNRALSLRAFREQQEKFTPQRTEREARRPGREGRPSPQERRAALGVIVRETPDQRGVEVLKVRPGSPADQAGIRAGDRILAIGDQNVESPQKLSDLIRQRQPGDRLQIRLLREGQEQTVEATLVGREEAFGRAERMRDQRREARRQEYPEDQQAEMADQRRAWLGLFLSEEDEQEGVEVLRIFPGSPADRAGLQTGDVILSIAGQDVMTVDDVTELLRGRQPGERVPIVVLRDNQRQELQAQLGDRARFLREQRRLREEMPFRDRPFREGMRLGPGADRLGEEAPWSMILEQERQEAEQRERLEQIGQQMLEELRALRQEVRQLDQEMTQQQQPKQ